MIKILPFNPTPENYTAIANLWNEAWPDIPLNANVFIKSDQENPSETRHQRWLAKTTRGETIAYGSIFPYPGAAKPGSFYMHLHVTPAYQNQGVGNALLDEIEKYTREYKAKTKEIITDTYDDRKSVMRFLNKRNFTEDFHYATWELDLDHFGADKFVSKVEQVKQSGIQIETLETLSKTCPEWQKKAWELDWEVLKDAPAILALQQSSLDEFINKRLKHEDFRADLWFIALDGDKWIGETILAPYEADPERLYISITGVKSAYRRRGIATALKTVSIQQAQTIQAKYISTNNWENNTGIDFINQEMGFKRKPSEVLFRKSIP